MPSTCRTNEPYKVCVGYELVQVGKANVLVRQDFLLLIILFNSMHKRVETHIENQSRTYILCTKINFRVNRPTLRILDMKTKTSDINFIILSSQVNDNKT